MDKRRKRIIEELELAHDLIGGDMGIAIRFDLNVNGKPDVNIVLAVRDDQLDKCKERSAANIMRALAQAIDPEGEPHWADEWDEYYRNQFGGRGGEA